MNNKGGELFLRRASTEPEYPVTGQFELIKGSLQE
jgi:hypothetical protein